VACYNLNTFLVSPGEAKRRPGIQGNCLNSSINLELKPGSRIKSGMTKKKIFRKPSLTEIIFLFLKKNILVVQLSIWISLQTQIFF
jgi:hypothetical protein